MKEGNHVNGRDVGIGITKVLSLVEHGCSGFSMEWDVPPSCLVPIFGTGNVPRRPDQNAGTLVGWPYLDTWDGIRSCYPAGHSTRT